MDQFLQALINGVMLGGFYAVMALGFSMIWGVMGVINLAHGEFLLLGAYMTWLINQRLGWEPLLALPLVMAAMFLLGHLLQRVLINRIVDRPPLISLLVTYALSIIIANGLKLLFTGTPRTVETVLRGFWRVGELTVPTLKSYDLALALLMMAGLHLFLHATRLGKAIRAAAQNREAARMVGIEIAAVNSLAFALSLALTGGAGTLFSTTQPVAPFVGLPYTLRAFAITTMAGLGNIGGTLLASLLLALVEVLVATYVPRVGTTLGVVASFLLLVIVLVARPSGLFGGLKPVQQEP